jgi:hypothetical protein
VIALYIVLFLIACAVVGKLITRSRDHNNTRFGSGFPLDQRPTRSMVDPVENPRMVDDGTDFGYKEFD